MNEEYEFIVNEIKKVVAKHIPLKSKNKSMENICL